MVPEEEFEGQEQKKGKGIIKWLILLLLLIVLGAGAYFAYTKFFAGGSPETAEEQVEQTEEAKVEEPGEAQLVTLPAFVVNLADPLGRRYLKLALDVEVSSQKAADDIAKNQAKIKDAILLLLSSKTYQELQTLENKLLLKKEIVDRLNLILGEATVKRVYITEMVIQ